ncbi:MAG: VanW family protein [Oscillospiraceae bacterium]|nr:VanW family protein [Oscillospiraceae bacterium]
MGGSRPDNRSFSELDKSFEEFLAEEGLQETVDTGATQRVKIENIPASPVPSTPRPPRRAPEDRNKPAAPQKRKRKMSRKDQTTIIALCAVAAVLLIAIVIAVIAMTGNKNDDGLIKGNVYAAGVNLGGMTQEQAKAALAEVAQDYDQLDMVVEVLDTTVLLTPGNTGANLNVDAVVKAAFEYGRNGEKVQNQATHTISIVPYLNLDTDYIRTQVDALGQKYSTLRSDPKVEVGGTAPPAVMENYDTSVVYQTMKLYIGTAEYDLNADKLYQQVLDAYDSNIFEVVAECSVLAPETSAIDVLEQAYQQYCRDSVDASIDANYTVTAEVYGYGFDLDAVKDQVASAAYGTTLEIPMTFLKPDITAEDLAGNLFKDVLGSYAHSVASNDNLIANIKQVLKSLNGLILKSGDEFSFNALVGEPTRQRGYKPYSQYVGTVYTENVYGGGISQVASVLYYCALQADLEILERHSHAYAPEFIQTGLDADIKFGTMDLRFKNTTTEPIRIMAEYAGGKLTIQFLGTDTKDYTIEITFNTDKVYNPVTLLQTMTEGNSAGYKGGEILQTGILGYDISVYKHCTYKPVMDENGEIVERPDEVLPFDVPVGQSHYEKRNIVQIDIYVPPVTEPDPSESQDPSESTGSSESTGTTETTGSTETSEPTESTGSTESTGTNNNSNSN